MPEQTLSPEAMIGSVISNRYRIESHIGRGGMGSVFAAVHTGSGRNVAVKYLLHDPSAVAELEGRFEREARAASMLRHPHIVEVLALGRDDERGNLFLIMELVNGESIRGALDDGALPPRRALVLARQALSGLSYAHEHGMIHRDIKPENLMIAKAGRPGNEYDVCKILDFGLVKLTGLAAAEIGDEKLTQTGFVCGTPAYISPEQALGRPVDGRADIYAMGVIVFEMLTGEAPFSSSDPTTLLRMHVSAPPPTLRSRLPDAPWCTPELEHFVASSIAKKPDDRFATASAAIAALDAAFQSLDAWPEL